MKKIVSIILAIAIIFAFVGCGEVKEEEPNEAVYCLTFDNDMSEFTKLGNFFDGYAMLEKEEEIKGADCYRYIVDAEGNSFVIKYKYFDPCSFGDNNFGEWLPIAYDFSDGTDLSKADHRIIIYNIKTGKSYPLIDQLAESSLANLLYTIKAVGYNMVRFPWFITDDTAEGTVFNMETGLIEKAEGYAFWDDATGDCWELENRTTGEKKMLNFSDRGAVFHGWGNGEETEGAFIAPGEGVIEKYDFTEYYCTRLIPNGEPYFDEEGYIYITPGGLVTADYLAVDNYSRVYNNIVRVEDKTGNETYITVGPNARTKHLNIGSKVDLDLTNPEVVNKLFASTISASDTSASPISEGADSLLNYYGKNIDQLMQADKSIVPNETQYEYGLYRAHKGETLYFGAGNYDHVVCYLECTDSGYSVLGLRVGDSEQKMLDILGNYTESETNGGYWFSTNKEYEFRDVTSEIYEMHVGINASGRIELIVLGCPDE